MLKTFIEFLAHSRSNWTAIYRDCKAHHEFFNRPDIQALHRNH